MTTPQIYRGLLFFLWAGACQLSGSYFLWGAIRGNRSVAMSLLGIALLVASAFIIGLQGATLGRVYTAYAGVLAIMSLLWGWHYTRVQPDIIDIIGTVMVVGGISIIFLTPRT